MNVVGEWIAGVAVLLAVIVGSFAWWSTAAGLLAIFVTWLIIANSIRRPELVNSPPWLYHECRHHHVDHGVCALCGRGW